MTSLKELLGKPSPDADLDAMLLELSTESDAATALLLSSHVEFWLEEATAKRGLPGLTPEVRSELFPDGKPAGTFGAKALLAVASGVIGPKAYADLKVVREIRNVFAHPSKHITFREQAIASKIWAIDARNRHADFGPAFILDAIKAEAGDQLERRLFEISALWFILALRELTEPQDDAARQVSSWRKLLR